jgi:UDP-N-acetylglucosamine 4,6-dehydratase
MSIFKDKVILITGGTGSFGKACVKKLLESHSPAAIRIFSRDELKQWEMAREFDNHPKLRFLIGDVRDAGRLRRAFEGVDYVIHAAALKHVPACEYNPVEAVRTNVDGAINVINAALDTNVKKVIALSTDKAVNPVNIYGATKLASDRLFIQSNSYSGQTHPTRFSAVRYGNVMGSRGSVIPLFRKQAESGVLTITDPRMTRFWITLPQAVDFVLTSFEIMQGGEIFVPKIPSMKITDLAKVIAPKAKLKVVGIRPGEKLHESLTTQEESATIREMKDRYIVLSPSREWPVDESFYNRYKKVKEGFEYNSLDNKDYMSLKEMSAMLDSLAL